MRRHRSLNCSSSRPVSIKPVLILTGERPAELDPFAVERFAGHRLRARRATAPARSSPR
jgi:hypothetical protein